jgi:replicative DNA helicase
MKGDHPPHDPEAEAAVISAIMLSDTALYTVIDLLHASDFYVESHRIIFEAIVALVREGQAVDLITVKSKLTDSKKLQQAGGVVAISALLDCLPDVSNAGHYAEVVKGHATRRGLIEYGRKVATSALSAESSKEALDDAMLQLTKLAESSSSGAIMHIADYADGVVDELEALANGSISKVGVRTGLTQLDSKVLMRNGRVIVLAGATSSGKSSLAMQIADQVATAGQSVALFSLEMSGEELATRIMSARSGYDQRRIEGGPATPKMVDDLKSHVKTLRGVNLYIDDNPACTPLDIRARARQVQMRYGLDLVIVDYLQLLTAVGERGRSREQEVSAMSRSLKIAARALSVPMIVLSQLSRRHLDEKRKPELRDLRESGAIENDADIVIMVYRPDLEDAGGELLVRKQRQGPLGRIQVSFNTVTTRFSEDNVDGLGQYRDYGAPNTDGAREVDEDQVDY